MPRLLQRLCAVAAVVAAAACVSLTACVSEEAPDESLWRCEGYAVTPDSIITPAYRLVLPERDICSLPEEKRLSRSLRLTTCSPLIDSAFAAAMALPEMSDSIFTGASVTDIALYGALLRPEASELALKTRVDRSAGVVADSLWPLRGGRCLWVAAAAQVYRAGGSDAWLRYAGEVGLRTLAADIAVRLDSSTGLLQGLLNPEAVGAMPRWMEQVDRFESQGLGANAAAISALKAQALMETAMGNDSLAHRLSETAAGISSAVNMWLWQPDLYRYSEYIYTGLWPIAARISDNGAQAAVVLCGAATPDQARMIFCNTPRLPFGMPSYWPLPSGTPPPALAAMSPRVQALWGIAGAYLSPAASEPVMTASLSALLLRCFGPDATDDALRGVAALTLRGVLGISLSDTAMSLRPRVPRVLGKGMALTGLRYRNATLDITVAGFGSTVARVDIDGEAAPAPVVPATLTGHHTVDITLAGNMLAPVAEPVATTPLWCPPVPELHWLSPRVGTVIDPRPGESYDVWLNGGFYENSQVAGIDVMPRNRNFSKVCVTARSVSSGLTGLSGKPHEYTPSNCVRTLQAEDFAGGGTRLVRDSRMSRRFVETSPEGLTEVTFAVAMREAQLSALRLVYANGSGPEGSGRACAIRTVSVNGRRAGSFVLPSKGSGWWLATGTSNTVTARLEEGINTITVAYDPALDHNPGGDNVALYDYLRIIRL